MITIFFDGLCKPKNPGGVASCGYVIYRDGRRIRTGSGFVGSGDRMTNNVAEFFGLKKAVEWLITQNTDEEIVIKGDSALVINQVKGVWLVKSETSKKFVPLIQNMLNGRKVTFTWIPREENAEADALSEEAYNDYLSNDGAKID